MFAPHSHNGVVLGSSPSGPTKFFNDLRVIIPISTFRNLAVQWLCSDTKGKVVATMVKRNGKWQAQVMMKGIRRSKSFTKKQLASQWANKVEAEIINGTFEDNNDLIKMSVRELINLYYDHAKSKTEHASRLRDEYYMIANWSHSDLNSYD